jgi:cyclohexanecarboxyl-CoA dehydrogenase
MVSFAFTEEQDAFREALETYARKVLLPGYRDRAASADFPFEILADLGKLGVLGIGLPTELGGTGEAEQDPILLGLAAETLAYGDVNVAA